MKFNSIDEFNQATKLLEEKYEDHFHQPIPD